jgi:hypothetical protein
MTYEATRSCTAMALSLACLSLMQSTGNVATGEILSKTEKILQLNMKPCADKIEASNQATFVHPWKEKVLGSKTCPKIGNKEPRTYTEVQVEQLEEPADKATPAEPARSKSSPPTSVPQDSTPQPPSASSKQ